MPGQLSDIATSDAFYLVIGALLAGLVGYFTAHLQEAQKVKAVRRGLGALLHGELVSMRPPDDPITRNPDQAWRFYLRSIPLLLAPGVLDPDEDADLVMQLISLASFVDTFNERARLYDEAFANGEPREKLQLLYNALQMSHWDYQRSHAHMERMLWLLGPPMPLYTRVVPRHRTLRRRFNYWRTRKTRKAWEQFNAINEAEEITSNLEEIASKGR